MMKLISKIFLFCFIVLAQFSWSAEVDSKLQEIFEKIEQKSWIESMELLLTYPEGNPEVNLLWALWALWYGDKDNPKYDLVKSTKSLEMATKLGSRDAQLLLVGRYLFSSNPEVTNYLAGVELGRDLIQFYEGQLEGDQKLNGEANRIVGKFYVFGIGVEKDIDRGMSLIKKAAELGDEEAKIILEQ